MSPACTGMRVANVLSTLGVNVTTSLWPTARKSAAALARR
jgi:hypothetical protein